MCVHATEYAIVVSYPANFKWSDRRLPDIVNRPRIRRTSFMAISLDQFILPPEDKSPSLRKPSWLKMKMPGGETHGKLLKLVNEKKLHTVCQSAKCPNLGECWSAGTATLMILGDVCTRSCG